MIIKTGDLFALNMRVVSTRAWRLNVTPNLVEYWEGNQTKPFEYGNGLNLNILENEEGNPGITITVLYKMDVTKVDPDDWDKYQDRFFWVQKVTFDQDSVSFRDGSGCRHFMFFDKIDSIHFTQEV